MDSIAHITPGQGTRATLSAVDSRVGADTSTGKSGTGRERVRIDKWPSTKRRHLAPVYLGQGFSKSKWRERKRRERERLPAMQSGIKLPLLQAAAVRLGLGRRARGHLDVGRLGVLLGQLGAGLLVLLGVRLLAVARAVQHRLAGDAGLEVRRRLVVRVRQLLSLVALRARPRRRSGGCRAAAG